MIDLDAALSRGSNDELVRMLASKAAIRVDGDVCTVERAKALIAQGARKVIVETAAFTEGINQDFLASARDAIGRERLLVVLDSKNGRIAVKGWRESTNLTAEEVLSGLEPFCSGFLCTYVDKEGRCRARTSTGSAVSRAATPLKLTAAGGPCSQKSALSLP